MPSFVSKWFILQDPFIRYPINRVVIEKRKNKDKPNKLFVFITIVRCILF